METPRFVFNGVDQCWSCRNNKGSGEHELDGVYFILPYCRVCDADMVKVYDTPCKGFRSIYEKT